MTMNCHSSGGVMDARGFYKERVACRNVEAGWHRCMNYCTFEQYCKQVTRGPSSTGLDWMLIRLSYHHHALRNLPLPAKGKRWGGMKRVMPPRCARFLGTEHKSVARIKRRIRLRGYKTTAYKKYRKSLDRKRSAA